jgi:hypothetical protein
MPAPIDPLFYVLLIHAVIVVLLVIAIVNRRAIEGIYRGPYPVGCLLPLMILGLVVFSGSSAVLILVLLHSN